MQKLAKRIPALDDNLLLWVILKGLHPQIKTSVIQQKSEIKTVADILELAKIAESAGLGNEEDSTDDPLMNQLYHKRLNPFSTIIYPIKLHPTVCNINKVSP